MVPLKLRLTLVLGGVGALLAMFSFQAIADGKTGSALESGGVAVLS